MRRVRKIHDVHKAADASVGLADVVRPAVRGKIAHVAFAAWQLDVGLEDRVATVRGVIHGKPWPVVLGGHEEVAPLIGLQILMRVQRRGSVVQIRGRMRMLRIGSIDHRDAGMALQGGILVRSIVGAVTVVRRSILRIGSLASVLAHELEIAVVGAFGIAAETFFRRRLAL